MAKNTVTFSGKDSQMKAKRYGLMDHTMTKLTVFKADAEGDPIMDDSKKVKAIVYTGELDGMDQYQRFVRLKTKSGTINVNAERIIDAVQNPDIKIPAGCELASLPEWNDPMK